MEEDEFPFGDLDGYILTIKVTYARDENGKPNGQATRIEFIVRTVAGEYVDTIRDAVDKASAIAKFEDLVKSKRPAPLDNFKAIAVAAALKKLPEAEQTDKGIAPPKG